MKNLGHLLQNGALCILEEIRCQFTSKKQNEKRSRGQTRWEMYYQAPLQSQVENNHEWLDFNNVV